MKNRISSMGKSLLGAVCLLSACGVTYSCSDDFDLDGKINTVVNSYLTLKDIKDVQAKGKL